MSPRIQIPTPLLNLNRLCRKASRDRPSQAEALASFQIDSAALFIIDFHLAASLVRSVLGISPSAWDDAQKVMGEIPAAILIACILQRASTIKPLGFKNPTGDIRLVAEEINAAALEGLGDV